MRTLKSNTSKKNQKNKKLLKTAEQKLEMLEARIAPSISTIAVGSTGTFTDASGDVVTIRVDGTSGSAVFSDGAGQVDDGNDIATVTINGASSDFSITYIDTDAATAGGQSVEMGVVTVNGSATIRGLFTVASDSGGILT